MNASSSTPQLIEAVPNFSEGRNPVIIQQIADAMAYDAHGRLREGMRVLHIDSGYAAHRTVITLAGRPEVISEALFQGIRMATALIDMRQHQGVHPRIGATDVCPLIPLQGISMSETVDLARKLAQRVAAELQIPVYLYEAARLREARKRLASIRKGEFEGLAKKMRASEWEPDYGPSTPHPTAGAVVIGARPFLIAFNVHLDTRDVQVAQSIASAIRESQLPSGLKGLRAIGWYVEEYGLAQVSMNITNVVQTPLHLAFEAVKREAADRGVSVKGSEIIGLVPLACMLAAGAHYAKQTNPQAQAASTDIALIQLAIAQMGLNHVQAFDPRQKILEYVLQQYPDVFPLSQIPLPLVEHPDTGIYLPNA
ncbi:MAG: glutamate formimidoyltransferase [Thermoflavifilum sp.]|nr:glutamate formimidoyltransferase [Thermoflavifilum sp.]